MICAQSSKWIEIVCHKYVDNVEITAVVLQVGLEIVEGFAVAKCRSNGKPFGNGRNSLLFNLTRDTLLSFRSRVPGACHLFATSKLFTFGRKDLVLVRTISDIWMISQMTTIRLVKTIRYLRTITHVTTIWYVTTIRHVRTIRRSQRASSAFGIGAMMCKKQ